MIPNKYYMHDQAMDVCFYVLSVDSDGSCYGIWYNLGYCGKPWPIHSEPDKVYLNGQWTDITDKITLPRPWPVSGAI